MNKKRNILIGLWVFIIMTLLVSCGADVNSANGENIEIKTKTKESIPVERIVLDRELMKERYILGEGDKAPRMDAEFEFLEPGISVLEVDDEYLWAYAGNKEDGYTKVLVRSNDLGESWEKVYVFDKKIEGIHKSSTGILYVSISNDRWSKNANCEIMRSEDNGKTFDKVLDIKSGAAITWNFASDEDGYVFVSEYGYKELPDNARRIYRSKDNGLKWEVVYEPKERFHHHNHIIGIDKDDNNIIYQSIGDVHKEVIVSRDRGDTWKKLIHDINPTGMIDFGDEILWGLDNHPKSGIMKFNKKTKDLDFALDTPEPYSGSIYDLLYANDIVYAGLLSYSQESHKWPGTMFISKDKGKTWQQFASWPKLGEKSGVGFYNMNEKDGYGFINAQLPVYVDGKPTHYMGTLRFKLLENEKMNKVKSEISNE